MKKSNTKVIIFYVILIAIVIIATASIFGELNTGKSLTYSEVVDLFKNEEVKSFEVDTDNYLTIVTQSDEIYTFRLQSVSIFYNDLSELYQAQHEAGIIEKYNFEEPVDVPIWVSVLPYVLVIILFIALWIFIIRSTTGKNSKINSFGRIRAKVISEDKKKVFFKDVAGADEEKAELQEIVEFLKEPAKFTKLGAKIPHGVLLVGPPGTGKTLLAKAVAGEAGVPFFAISGSDFVEMYVGVGASRVRDLFETAKKHPASIIFIDEIDAVGRHRGAGLGGGHDEREQTLNQILVEMDGFDTSDGVIVMAATNRPDILDPALLRPGRFDRRITVNYPDIRGREDILRVHAKNKPLEADVNLNTVAKSTVGFTGADLANLLNEAALLAVKRGKSLIGMNDIEDATIKIAVGPQKKNKVISEKEKRLTAYHEAGHAIITHEIQPETPVHQISIIPSGSAGGYTLSLPKEDKEYMSKREMENEIVSLLGGRVAEALILGDISTGASNDIQRATNMARNMITKYGMSDLLGPIVYGTEHSDDEVFLGRDFSNSRNYSEQTASIIDEEIKKIIGSAYKKAQDILNEKIDKLHFIASFLFKDEVMDEGQFNTAMDNEDVTIEQLEEIMSEQRKRSQIENERAAERMASEAAKKAAEEAEKADAEKKNNKV